MTMRTVSTRGDGGAAFSVRWLLMIAGCIGLLLPTALVVVNGAACGAPWFADSVSQFYYRGSHALFVAALATVGVLLSAYHGWRGESQHERVLGFVAGVGALGVAFLPTGLVPAHDARADVACAALGNALNAFGPHGDIAPPVLTAHYVCAGVLFAILTYFCWFSFQQSSGDENANWKPVRNGIYRALAITMVVGIIYIVFGNLGWLGGWVKSHNPIFVGETIALMAFGAAWLVRSRAVLGYAARESGLLNYQANDEKKLLWRSVAKLGATPTPAASH
jgi:hypothetical protein